jgi:hypothetical protein
MRYPLVCLALSVVAIPAIAQKMDQAAMMKWANAKVIYYTVEGVHSGEILVTNGPGGYGTVADRVTMNLEWSLADNKLLKVSGLTNTPAEVSKLRDYERKCNPPVLKGPLEMTVLEVAQNPIGMLDIRIEKSFPAAEVSQVCTSKKAVAAAKKVEMIQMMVPSPVMLAMGAPSTKELVFNPDGKSMTVKEKNWSWTFTPSDTRPK